MLDNSFNQSFSKRTFRSWANFILRQTFVSQHLVQSPIYLLFQQLNLKFNWVELFLYFRSYFLHLLFQITLDIGLLFLLAQSITQFFLFILSHLLIREFKRIYFFKLSLTVLLVFFFELQSFFVKMIRRMPFPLRLQMRCFK